MLSNQITVGTSALSSALVAWNPANDLGYNADDVVSAFVWRAPTQYFSPLPPEPEYQRLENFVLKPQLPVKQWLKTYFDIEVPEGQDKLTTILAVFYWWSGYVYVGSDYAPASARISVRVKA